MQGAQKGEQPPGGGDVDPDLAVQALAQQLRALVVQAATAHVDGLDLGGRGVADGLVIALADGQVVADDGLEVVDVPNAQPDGAAIITGRFTASQPTTAAVSILATSRNRPARRQSNSSGPKTMSG